MALNPIRRIEGFFGFYSTGYEYQIKVDDIIIPETILYSCPRTKKMAKKLAYYNAYGEFDKDVHLTKDLILVDGYITYCLAVRQGLRKAPCVFVEDDTVTNSRIKNDIEGIRSGNYFSGHTRKDKLCIK